MVMTEIPFFFFSFFFVVSFTAVFSLLVGRY